MPGPIAPCSIEAILHGHRGAQLLHAAAKLGIFQSLRDEPRSYVEIAQECGADAQAVRRILRGLVYYNVATQIDIASFASGPLLGELSTHNSRVFLEVLSVGDLEIPVWEFMELSARAGKPAFDLAFGKEFFAHLNQQDARLERHTRIMSAMSTELANELVDAFDFSQFGRIVDVGGGEGAVLAAILRRYPNCEGTVFDLAEVIALARANRTITELPDPVRFVAGDFFVNVPAGGDLYFLKWILHNWDDRECSAILKNCRQAGGRNARIMICEHVAPEIAVPGAVALQADLTMMAFHHGHERTFLEFDALLEQAGFRFEDAIRLATGRYLLIAIAASNH